MPAASSHGGTLFWQSLGCVGISPEQDIQLPGAVPGQGMHSGTRRASGASSAGAWLRLAPAQAAELGKHLLCAGICATAALNFRELLGIELQSWMSIPRPPKQPGLSRIPGATPLFPGLCCRSSDDSLRREAFLFEDFLPALWQQDILISPQNLAASVGTQCEDIWLHGYSCMAGLCCTKETSQQCWWSSGPRKISL